ncbi:MAG: energy-coupling factor transporter transmembrane protein EcfT [Salinirussus sp.]
MLSYRPGTSVAHRLDPRTKLAFQAGFAVAAFVRPTVPRLAALSVLALGCLAAARLSPLRALWAYRFVLLVLAAGPLLGGVVAGPPWFRVAGAVESALAVARVVPLLLVSAAFVHSTPVRQTRAAVQRTVPGRAGRLLGVGVGLAVRFVPVVRGDVDRIRDALRARGGDTRSLRDRAVRIATLSLGRALGRADRLSVALRARCLAWNPTLPALRFSRLDYPVLLAAVGLVLSPLL